MLDDFRKQADSAPFSVEEEPPDLGPRPIENRRYFLGMSPFQRFVVSLLVLIIACMLGGVCLLVSEAVWIPGLF